MHIEHLNDTSHVLYFGNKAIVFYRQKELDSNGEPGLKQRVDFIQS